MICRSISDPAMLNISQAAFLTSSHPHLDNDRQPADFFQPRNEVPSQASINLGAGGSRQSWSSAPTVALEVMRLPSPARHQCLPSCQVGKVSTKLAAICCLLLCLPSSLHQVMHEAAMQHLSEQACRTSVCPVCRCDDDSTYAETAWFAHPNIPACLSKLASVMRSRFFRLSPGGSVSRLRSSASRLPGQGHQCASVPAPCRSTASKRML